MKLLNVAASVIPLFGILFAGPLSAQEWGDKMFDRLNIKFGTVARLADTSFNVTIKNPYAEEITITNLNTSCGCISWTEPTPISIASRAERVLTIRLDTVRHSGEKHVKAIVTLSEPIKGLTSVVTLPVEGRIRDDFEVRPSSVAFGGVDVGRGYTQRISVSYKGRNDWKILSAKVASRYLATRVVEISRANGTVRCDILVELKPDAPVGVLRDQLILTTNELGSPEIPIPVEAKIENDIVVADAHFGMVTVGHPKSMTVVVRGKNAFEIEKVEHVANDHSTKLTANEGIVRVTSDDSESAPIDKADAFKAEFATTSTTIHMVTLTFTPTDEAGMFDENFSVTIRGRTLPVTFHAKGRVLNQSVTSLAR